MRCFSQEEIEEVEKGLKYFKKNKDRLSSLYKKMYREDICLTCKGSVQYGFEKLFNDRNKELPIIVMKKGRVINTHLWDDNIGVPKNHYTCHNITDDIAEKLIKLGWGEYFL